MTGLRAYAVALGTAALFAACGSAPPAPVPIEKNPAAQPAVAVPGQPRRAEPRAWRAPALMSKLPNGLTVAITASPPGEAAQLQLGMFAGSLFVAPGLAELAAQVLVEGADPSRGRPSLVQAVANLGGSVQVEIGPVTSWICLRVPGGAWMQAQAALQAALAAPTQSRNQIERIRDELVQQRSNAIRLHPDATMARALMLGESSTAQYINSLLDRDPTEINLFQSRMHRPERAVLALRVPGEPEQVAAALANAGTDSLASWLPTTPAAAAGPMLERAFASGFHCAPGKTPGTCRIAFVLCQAEPANPHAADLLMLHECLTLDGAGGRLERLQRERGLGAVRFRSEFVQTADALSIVLSADVKPDDVAPLWETLQLARNSLRDVPPTRQELGLALRRAMLAAHFGQLDATAGLRVETQLLLRGTSMAAFEQRLDVLGQADALDLRSAVLEYLKLPVAGIVLGGEMTTGIEGARRFDVLPKGFDEPMATASPGSTTGSPWLAQAVEAAGGEALLRRFTGLQAEGRLANDRAPAATETLSWQTDGTLRRARELLGSKIETELRGEIWTEQLGDEKHTLDSREVALLQRELQRHPLALLAAHVRGELYFRAIAQRNVGDRDLMILEATGDRFDRLRLHIDAMSHLVRVVEVWETMPDGTNVHLQDAWSDYRSTGGLRAPFRRITTQNDGQNRVEMVFASWVPQFSVP